MDSVDAFFVGVLLGGGGWVAKKVGSDGGEEGQQRGVVKFGQISLRHVTQVWFSCSDRLTSRIPKRGANTMGTNTILPAM